MFGRRHIIGYFILAAAVSTAISCGPKVLGYGVVLWSTDEQQIATGDTAPVFEDSSIRDVYIAGTGEDNETLIELPRARMAFFKKEKDALEYAETYRRYNNIFARTLKDGLAVRSEPDPLSERVYKLREGQLLKIIDKLEPPETVGDHQDNWYYVMTEEGIPGYSFGHNIDIYDRTEAEEAAVVQAGDPKLDAFLNRVYRPDYYKDMLDEGRIDLERFTTDFGVFPNLETRKIRIILPETTRTVQYETIEKTGDGRYSFTGSGLQVLTLTMNRVALTISADGEGINGEFHYIDGIEDIRTAEQERRETMQIMFGELGTLRSAAYGTLSFQEDGRFIWENYDRLIPSVIPQDAGSGGSIVFDRFIVNDLKADYDGALTFVFEDSTGTRLCFLYSLTDEGLRLVYVPEKDISEGIVQRENPSPIVLFFSR